VKPIAGISRQITEKVSSRLLVWRRDSFRIENVQSRAHRNLAHTSLVKIEAVNKVLLRAIAEVARFVQLPNTHPVFCRDWISEDVKASLVMFSLSSSLPVFPGSLSYFTRSPSRRHLETMRTRPTRAFSFGALEVSTMKAFKARLIETSRTCLRRRLKQ